jgi:hypothetical protein
MDGSEFVTEFVADSGFNRDGVFAGADDDRVQSEQNAVFFVSRRALLPERFGDDAKHRSTVKIVGAITQNRNFKIA